MAVEVIPLPPSLSLASPWSSPAECYALWVGALQPLEGWGVGMTQRDQPRMSLCHDLGGLRGTVRAVKTQASRAHTAFPPCSRAEEWQPRHPLPDPCVPILKGGCGS